MLGERSGALETGFPETQAAGMSDIGGKPFRVDVEHEEDCAVLDISGDEIMRLPGIDGDDSVLCEETVLIAHVDACRRSADMEDQMPLAMRMHVERAVQLIDRRAAKTTVEDGKRSAHAFPSRRIFILSGQRRSYREQMQVGSAAAKTAAADPTCSAE